MLASRRRFLTACGTSGTPTTRALSPTSATTCLTTTTCVAASVVLHPKQQRLLHLDLSRRRLTNHALAAVPASICLCVVQIVYAILGLYAALGTWAVMSNKKKAHAALLALPEPARPDYHTRESPLSLPLVSPSHSHRAFLR